MVYRKTLFGYSILNLDTLKEYNFFPEEGIKGEAYIAIQAYLFKDILIFDGCYWSGPYGYFFAKLFTDDTFYFSESFGMDKYFESSDLRSPLIKDDSVVLFNNDGNSKELSYKEVLLTLR